MILLGISMEIMKTLGETTLSSCEFVNHWGKETDGSRFLEWFTVSKNAVYTPYQLSPRALTRIFALKSNFNAISE